MSIKEKLLVYPYSAQFCPFLRHQTLIQNYEISQVVSPAGWGLAGNDAGIADCGNNIGVIISDNFNESLGECETVLFVDSSYKLDFSKYIYPKIIHSIEKRKNIIIAFEINCEAREKIEIACNDNNVYFKYLGVENEELPDYKIIKDNLLKIGTPVIFVLGLTENMSKLEIQACIREGLIKEGYKVSQIGTRTYSEILGMHHFPRFMFSLLITESQKIIMFNRFIREIEVNEKPDVIIVGIPGGVLPFNNDFTNRFGMLAIEVSMALKPDMAILSIPFGEYEAENYSKIAEIVKHRLGYDIDIINLSNIMPDWLKINQGLEMTFVTVGTDLVNTKKKANLCFPVLNILDSNDSRKLTRYIIDTLSEYGQIEMI